MRASAPMAVLLQILTAALVLAAGQVPPPSNPRGSSGEAKSYRTTLPAEFD